jgi:gas vesicle protein
MKKLTRVLRTALDVFDLCDGASTAARDRVGDYADRARKVFRSQRSHPFRNISSFAVATGLGLGVGLLLAPASGAETRREIFTRKAFRSQRSHPFRNISSFAVGTGLGLGVSLLFAPARGAETRREIVRRAERVGSTVRERFSPAAKKPFATASASRGGIEQAAE